MKEETLRISSQIGDGDRHAPPAKLAAKAFVKWRHAQWTKFVSPRTYIKETLVGKLPFDQSS